MGSIYTKDIGRNIMLKLINAFSIMLKIQGIKDKAGKMYIFIRLGALMNKGL